MIRIPRERDTGDDSTIPAGRALVQITSAREDADDEKVLLRYRVVAMAAVTGDQKEIDQLASKEGDSIRYSLMPEMAGACSTEKFPTTPGALPRLSTLFKRLGIIDRGEPTDDAAEYDLAELVGHQVVVDVQGKVSEKGTAYTQWGFSSTWGVNDARVAKFMRHLQTTQRAGATQPGTTQRPQQPQQPNPNGQRQPAPAGAIDPEV